MWNELSTTIIEAIEGNFPLTLNISLANGYTFWITGVYAPNSITDRKRLWTELTDLSHLCLPNWIIGVTSILLDGLGRNLTHLLNLKYETFQHFY